MICRRSVARFVDSDQTCRVTTIVGGLSDPHNSGRMVAIVGFDDGARVAYKPKDLGVDAAWSALVERLNRGAPPVDLRAMRVLTRAGYGWTEFIEHASCAGPKDFSVFFRRQVLGWRCSTSLSASTCIRRTSWRRAHTPYPIDLEMILQAADTAARRRLRLGRRRGRRIASAMQTVLDSVAHRGTASRIRKAFHQ